MSDDNKVPDPSELAEHPGAPAEESPPEADVQESRPVEIHALRARLKTERDDGAALLGAMLPASADTQRIRAQIENVSPFEAYYPFVVEPTIDEHQLASFNDQFRAELADPVTPQAARATVFQTEENWHGYVTTGALHFISGGSVRRPLWQVLRDPVRDMTFALRPGQEPSRAPLSMALFADFGNGLYAAREVARRIIARAPPYAFHLGDVYYDGTDREFREYFEEPLAPLLRTTELFMLTGNHEMYSLGAGFQNYIMQKSSRQFGFQRQNAELFRLRGDGLQIIGLDTMFCDWKGNGVWRGNSPRLDEPTRKILKTWLEEGDPDGLTILLSSNEPWSIESSDTTKMLYDIEPYIRRGLIDLWFWGNVHHAALYDAWQFTGAVEHGFVGSCIGHGGYPFYTQKRITAPRGVTCRWAEQKHRFWPFAGVRPEMGLNGWCELSVSRDTGGWKADLLYRDWVGRDRARARVQKPRGMGPRVTSVEENEAPERGRSDWKPR